MFARPSGGSGVLPPVAPQPKPDSKVVAAKRRDNYNSQGEARDGWVTSLQFGEKAKVIASTFSGDVFLFDEQLSWPEKLSVGEPVRSVSLQGGKLKVLTLGTLRDYSRATLSELSWREFEPGDAVAACHSNSRSYVAGHGGTLQVWGESPTTRDFNRLITPLPPLDVTTTHMALGDGGLALAGERPQVLLHDSQSLELLHHFQVPFSPDEQCRKDPLVISDIAWHHSGPHLFAQGHGALLLYDVALQEVVRRVPTHTPSRPHLLTVGRGRCAVACEQSIVLRDSQSLALMHTLRDTSADITAIALDDNHLAVGCYNGDITLFELRKLDRAIPLKETGGLLKN